LGFIDPSPVQINETIWTITRSASRLQLFADRQRPDALAGQMRLEAGGIGGDVWLTACPR
jgi:hypothetical protein